MSSPVSGSSLNVQMFSGLVSDLGKQFESFSGKKSPDKIEVRAKLTGKDYSVYLYVRSGRGRPKEVKEIIKKNNCPKKQGRQNAIDALVLGLVEEARSERLKEIRESRKSCKENEEKLKRLDDDRRKLVETQAKSQWNFSLENPELEKYDEEIAGLVEGAGNYPSLKELEEEERNMQKEEKKMLKAVLGPDHFNKMSKGHEAITLRDIAEIARKNLTRL